MRSVRGVLFGLSALLVSCAAEVPVDSIETRSGIAASPYNYLPGLIEVVGGYQLYGEIDDPGIVIDMWGDEVADPATLGIALDGSGVLSEPSWAGIGANDKLLFNGSNLAYELTEDQPTDCACPSLEAVGSNFDFVYEVERPLRTGVVSLDLDVFWTIRSPTMRFDVVVFEGYGERVVGSAVRTFAYPWRHRVEFGVLADLAGVLPGDFVAVRITLIDADGELPQWVFNAGPGDRNSFVYLPVAD